MHKRIEIRNLEGMIYIPFFFTIIYRRRSSLHHFTAFLHFFGELFSLRLELNVSSEIELRWHTCHTEAVREHSSPKSTRYPLLHWSHQTHQQVISERSSFWLNFCTSYLFSSREKKRKIKWCKNLAKKNRPIISMLITIDCDIHNLIYSLFCWSIKNLIQSE